MKRLTTLHCLALALLCACGGGSVAPLPPAPGGSTPGAAVYDASSSACSVSYDGIIWYQVPSGSFSPIDVKSSKCGSSLSSGAFPPRPRWAVPHGATQTRFIATSLTEVQGTPPSGTQSIESAAAAAHVPVTWLVYAANYLSPASTYDRYHRSNGDDVEGHASKSLFTYIQRQLPWFVPTVSVEGVSHERDISGLLALGLHAFWGIAWNSHGIDGTWDYGAPWGSYCADPKSYKRPDPSPGSCNLLAFEWTARDLTRAYLSGHEEYYSTDPDDLQQRAQFSASAGQAYVRSIVDAYATAGETQPIVMMSQQESGQNTTPGDAQIMSALYQQAVADGMKVETFAAAVSDAKTFSANPRVVAFPFVPGGLALPSSILNGQTLYPATIDYHDNQTGMTFLAGHTLPTRVFRYADDPTSAFNVPFPTLPPSSYPTLTKAAVNHGTLALAFDAPVGLHFGIALWTNPAMLRITQNGAIPAGRAGEVVVFDLKTGPNQIVIACPGCKGTTLPYST